MQEFEIITFENLAVYAIGDLHGEFPTLMWYIKDRDIRDSLLIVCGDCGFGFESVEANQQTLNKLEKVIRERNVHIVFVRGNHDKPSIFQNKGNMFKRLKYCHIVKDYTVLEILNEGMEPYHILCVGGAISVDRFNRIRDNQEFLLSYIRWHAGCDKEDADLNARKCYWEDEPMFLDRDALDAIKTSGINIDCVVTHTAPSFCYPIEKGGNIGFWLAIDSDLNTDLDVEREIGKELYNILKDDGHQIKKWCYGHFHMHHIEEIDGILFCLNDKVRSCSIDYTQIL